MLTFSDSNTADNLYGAADVLACLTDLIANINGDFSFSDDGANGLCKILSGVQSCAKASAEHVTSLQVAERAKLAEEYQRGFNNGIAEGRRDNPQAEQRIAEILAQAMAKHSDAPIPKLTEEAPPAEPAQRQAHA